MLRMPEIIGQDKVLKMINAAIKTGKIGQAYLFHGPEGVGKLTTAFFFARAINCLTQDNELKPCERCKSCQKIKNFVHPDMLFYFPIPKFKAFDNENSAGSGNSKSENEKWDLYQAYYKLKQKSPWQDYQFDKTVGIHIEQIRTIQKELLMMPYEGKYRICIMENFDLITIQAANAFLKTLEEPPPNTIFILTVNNLNKLLPTILSRCILIEFFPLGIELIEKYLIDQRNCEQAKAKLFSRLASGSPKKALLLSENEDLPDLKIFFEFLELTVEHQDLSFLHWLELYFAANTQHQLRINELLLYLEIWLNDLLLYVYQPERITFIHQEALLLKYINKNPFYLDSVLRLVNAMEEYKQKISGNVNQKLVLSQVYLDLINVF